VTEPAAAAHRKADFLGLPLLATSTDEFIKWMLDLSDAAEMREEDSRHFVTYLNAACVNIAASDSAYRAILRQADGVYADGKAVVWASRWIGAPVPERVNAADFILRFCREAAARGKSVYLLGSAPGVAAAAGQRFMQETSGLQVLGAESGYFEQGDDAVVASIASASPDFLIIGMGVPLQETWAWQRRDRLNAQVVWCVGAMLEFYAGYRRRAPQWMCKAGLEWLFRLMIEPRRMWRRYLIGNIAFLWRVLLRRRIP
jgi:N-acetylglucosaminyldiphosphoundecaprenol N-acetyl-beta-D-mannosaminyltransferase